MVLEKKEKKLLGGTQKEDHGGFAGIHVPWNDLNNNGTREDGEQAELNLFGEGTVIAKGGSAGNGNGTYGTGDSNTGGRWRSDGAGARDRTEIGGKGGNANHEISNEIEGSGYDGQEGENCGIVNIYNNVTVKAYGGGGGSANPGTNAYAGTGGGGYPAARNRSVEVLGRWSEETTLLVLVDIAGVVANL